MWVSVSKILVYYIFLAIGEIMLAQGHIPNYVSTPSNKIEQFCTLADTCVHDTISICGKMGDEKRMFLDLCDMLEYACDTNNIFVHVEEEICTGKPPPK